jgi:sugar phosphate isomerase/epimerase
MSRLLALCHFTAVELEPPAFVDVAARAGFTAVSLMLQFPRSYSPGFPVVGDTPMRRETKRRARLTDRFAELCALCAEYGLGVGLEFMMSTQVKTLGEALAVIARSGAGNATVTVDALHLARSGGSPCDIAALGPARICYLQLCDGPAQPPEDGFAKEAAGERPLPGQGELPVRELVEAGGPDVVLGVEAPSRQRREAGIPADVYAARAFDSVRLLLDVPAV